MRPVSSSTRIAATLVAGAALVLQSQAALAQNCLTEREVTGLVTFALPTVMNSAITTCQPQLSPNGYFATQGRSLVARYAAGKAAAWPTAKAALFKLGGDKGDAQTRDLLAKMPDEALQPFAEGMVGQLVGSGSSRINASPSNAAPGCCAAAAGKHRRTDHLHPVCRGQAQARQDPKLLICPAQN
jgi:hypothetical protein